MNNYYGQYENQYNNYQGYHTNNYGLWQNSQCYDTSHRSYISNEWNDSENAAHDVIPSTSASLNRMVIDRQPLYKEPQFSGYNVRNRDTFFNPMQSSSLFGQSQQKWVKAGESSHESEEIPSEYKFGRNKLERKLNKALQKPVKMSKAESMMQKMGWQGGALGKSGDGILEPIAPNAVYATTTAGFGLHLELDKQKACKQVKKQDEKQIKKQDEKQVKKQFKKQVKKQYNKQKAKESKKQFYVKILQNILMFVRNDFEIEMAFDKDLGKGERKRIHMLVNEVISSESPEDAMYLEEVQTELLRQIEYYNCYSLTTQSHGEEPNRQLVLYKEAPAQVFLIIPDDLRDEEVEDDASEVDVNETNIKEKEDQNLEARDIGKGNQSSLERIVAYFEEFQGSDEFIEFKFLGPFNCDEIGAINKFLNDMSKCIDGCYSDVCQDLAKLFTEASSNFKIYQDINGSAVICKVNEEHTEQNLVI